MSKKRTKIVATLGPASSSKEVLRRMISAGLDVVRVNFSHQNDVESVRKTVDTVREAAAEEGVAIGILGDLRVLEFELERFKMARFPFLRGRRLY